MPKVPSKRRARQSTSRHLGNEEKHQNESEGQSCGNTHANGILSFDPKTNAEIFKDFYSNLANNLVKKLPTPPNKYGKTAVNNYYKKLNLRGKNFSFAPVAPATILKLLKQLNPEKSAGIDNLTGSF